MTAQEPANGKAILSPDERRRRNRDEMVVAILDAARAIMREDGVAALSLHEVARRVSLRTPSLYVYFRGKAALYDALFLLGVRLYAHRFRVAMSQPLPLWERLRVALETHMTFANECPELHQLVFERPVPGFVPSEEGMAASLSLLAEANAQVEQAFRAEGILPPVPFSQATDLIIAMQHGLTSLHAANEPNLPAGEERFGALIPAAVRLIESAWGTKPAKDPNGDNDANDIDPDRF
jgi:AcrR family transcriptional regulator